MNLEGPMGVCCADFGASQLQSMERAIVGFEKKWCGATVEQGESGTRGQEVRGVQKEGMVPPKKAVVLGVG